MWRKKIKANHLDMWRWRVGLRGIVWQLRGCLNHFYLFAGGDYLFAGGGDGVEAWPSHTDDEMPSLGPYCTQTINICIRLKEHDQVAMYHGVSGMAYTVC